MLAPEGSVRSSHTKKDQRMLPL